MRGRMIPEIATALLLAVPLVALVVQSVGYWSEFRASRAVDSRPDLDALLSRCNRARQGHLTVFPPRPIITPDLE